MLGAPPGSPFRAGHRAPWPPPSVPAAQQADGFGRYGVSSGLYSLFPGASEASAAIYSQATSTSTRFNTFHSFIGAHKVSDSLFSSNYSLCGGAGAGAGFSPGAGGGPVPLVERGLAGLELMAKGFAASQPAAAIASLASPAAPQPAPAAAPAAATPTGSRKHRRANAASGNAWDRHEVKTEARPSCGCRRQQPAPGVAEEERRAQATQHQQQQQLQLQHQQVLQPPPQPQQQQVPQPQQQQPQLQHQQLQAAGLLVAADGCSRTTWPPPIKKEPGTSAASTPCQVAEVTTSISPVATIKVEAASPAPLPLPLHHHASCKKDAATAAPAPAPATASIPVGIAVARQRQQHELKAIAAPAPPPQPAPAPAPAPADQASALSAMAAVLQAPPCDDRSANGVAPWAAAATHGSALTPPSLWQYPAPVPVQLGAADHSPLPPPVGYQLVRDPLSGHLLLIPAANIEHLQRAVLWSGSSATAATGVGVGVGVGFPTLQPQPQQPQPQQHIQLFEHPPEAAPATAAAAAETTTTTRILVQPQFTLTAHATAAAEQPQPAHTSTKKRTTVIKVEAADCTALEVKAPTLTRAVSSEVTTTAPIFPATNIATTHFFYEQHPSAAAATAATATATAVVQLSHTPQPQTHVPSQTQQTQSLPQMQQQQQQPSAAVQTETGKRSQATSPVNPADACLTPPPEVAASHGEEAEDPGSQPGQPPPVLESVVTVADASNQTDTPPCSEDETPAQQQQQQQQQQQPPVDVSGLELLSNSIEQFERERPSEPNTPVPNTPIPISPVPTVVTDATPTSTSTLRSPNSTRVTTLADEKAVEMLQMLSVPKVQEPDGDQVQPELDGSSVPLETAVVTSSTSDQNSSTICNGSSSSSSTTTTVTTTTTTTTSSNSDGSSSSNNINNNNNGCSNVSIVASSSSVNGVLGGLGLLCALAEQRIMEEVGHNLSKDQDMEPEDTTPELPKPAHQRASSVDSGVDVNRNYRTRKLDRQCKKSATNKQGHQYQVSSSEATSPQDQQHNTIVTGTAPGGTSVQIQSPATSPRSNETMDPMELKMRMRLADLQRRYREKQRELSRLTPKKAENTLLTAGNNTNTPVATPSPSEIGVSPASTTTNNSSSNIQQSPVKRGPGRPRKRCNRLAPNSPQRTAGRVSASKTNRDLPPVLEKVTEPPRLKASKLDILKPPTLTANRPKLRPAAILPETQMPQCNASLMKAKPKINGDISGTAPKLDGLFGSDIEKHSAFSLCRLPCHTFGSKPSSRLPNPGDSDVQSWFKTSEKPSVVLRQQEKEMPVIESTDAAVLPNATTATTTSVMNMASITTSTMTTTTTTATTTPVLSSSKKRKVGRPKKHLLDDGKVETTEMIVAKKPKTKNGLMGFLLSHPRLDSTLVSSQEHNKTAAHMISTVKKLPITDHKPKIRPKLKAEAKVKTWSWADDDDDDNDEENNDNNDDEHDIEWRSENMRPAMSKQEVKYIPWVNKNEKNDKVPAKIVQNESSGGTSAKRKLSNGDTKGTKPTKRVATASAHSASQDKNHQGTATKRQKRNRSTPGTKEVNRQPPTVPATNTASETEGEDLPLSVYSSRSSPPSCSLTASHLNTDKQRVLTASGGLFYAGTLSAIRPPDVYGVTLDGERGNRQHIYSREEVLKDAILEVRPSSSADLPPGTRLCAYWSQQYRCLYPGTVAQPSSPDPELDGQFVSVEFDDGDNGRINIDDIRLLPPDYPVVEYDPNPLLSLGKRRRRNSGTSCESHSKDRRMSNETTGVTASNTLATAAPKTDISISSTESAKGKNSSAADSESRSTALFQEKSETTSQHHDAQTTTDEKNTAQQSSGSTLLDVGENSSLRERRRLKKRRRDKLKRLLSCSGVLMAEGVALKKKRRKHHCCEEHCRHKRHHRRHRRRRHRHRRDSGSDSTSKSGHTSTDGASQTPPANGIQHASDGQYPNKCQETDVATSGDACASGVGTSSGSTTGESISGSTSEVDEDLAQPATKTKKEKETVKPKKCRDRQPSVESRSKMAAFLPARQLWGWSGRGFKRPGAKGRGRKEFYKAIQRGKESIRVGDCAVFLSTGRPDRPYIGRIESMWEAWGTNMVVRVKWFYHPEETNGCAPLKYPGALFESPHSDENDVQTISHKCEVLPLETYIQRLGAEPHRFSTIYDNNDIYYLAGYYDPTSKQLKMEPGVM